MGIIKILEDKKKQLHNKLLEKELLEKEVAVLLKQHEEHSIRSAAAGNARKLITLAAKDTQQNLNEYVSKIVNLALKSVFLDPPVFSMEFVERRNKTECDLLLNKENNTMESFAGGELDVVAFALRCAFLSMRDSRKTLILDETFKNLSVEYHEKCSDMIKTLSDKLGVQIILVSHIPGLITAADKTFKLRRAA